jgi:GNAT superfamily N-acetyltransferase
MLVLLHNGAMELWGPERADELSALVAAAAPRDVLSADELLACCWEGHDLSAVLADPEGRGAVGVVARRFGDGDDSFVVAYVTVIAVHPEHRRQGLGAALFAAAEEWAWAHHALELHLGGSAPFYLWPGVDLGATELVCLAESAGYEATGSELDMALPVTYRADPPAGVVTRRVIADADVAKLESFVQQHYPWWWDETARAVEHGCCHAAFGLEADTDDGDDAGTGTGVEHGERVVGFVCHSVNRAGMLGPMATDPGRQGGGIGNALVAQVCRDLMIAEFDEVAVSWVGPVRFYAKAGAHTTRVYRTYRKRQPARMASRSSR